MGLKAGDLRHLVVIEQPVQFQDPITGEITSFWAPVAETKASILPLSSRELIAAQQTQSRQNTNIQIRYRYGITSAMRVREVATGMVYEIHGVQPDNISGREWLTLVAERMGDVPAPEPVIYGGDAFSAGAGRISGGGA